MFQYLVISDRTLEKSEKLSSLFLRGYGFSHFAFHFFIRNKPTQGVPHHRCHTQNRGQYTSRTGEEIIRHPGQTNQRASLPSHCTNSFLMPAELLGIWAKGKTRQVRRRRNASSVPINWLPKRFAMVVHHWGDVPRKFLRLQWCFDKRNCQSSFQMPLDVALKRYCMHYKLSYGNQREKRRTMEEPNSGVVCNESKGGRMH